MDRKNVRFLSAFLVLTLFTLACGIPSIGGGGDTAGGGDAGGGDAGGTPISQWANSAVASSSYGENSWSAAQATGAPNTTECGDQGTAWASANGSQKEWLQVSFATAVYATQVVIHETYNPSFVTKVELLDTNGVSHTVYNASPAEMTCPYILTISFDKTDYLVSTVLITIDESTLFSWNEIDAVQLVGYSQ